MTILVLTCPEDVTADMVIDQLNGMGMSDDVLRLDPAGFPGRVHLEATCTAGRWTGRITHGPRSVALETIRSVWVRRPGRPGHGSTVQPSWTAHECDHALYGVLRALDGVRWMPPLDAYRAAQYKTVQLAWAHVVGLLTPDTIVTNVPSTAKEFANASPVVCKSVSGRQPDDPPMKLPTTTIPPTADFSAIAAAPTCLQRQVPKVADVRLTVVGDEMFAARADTGPDVVDWRYDIDQVPWKETPVPEPVRHKIQAFMQLAGLPYGALDFGIDADERWHFLEINPVGQFGFIELTTGAPIAAAIANWLADG